MSRPEIALWQRSDVAGYDRWQSTGHPGWLIYRRPAGARYVLAINGRPVGSYRTISDAIDTIAELTRHFEGE